MMMRVLLIILFQPLCSLGQNTKDSIKFAFAGEHDQTSYFYAFYNGGTYLSNITGHLGNEGETIGSYSIRNDTIFMKPFPKERQTNKYYEWTEGKFLIDGDSCIIDLDILFDYRKLKRGNNQIYYSKERIYKSIPKRKLDK